MRLLRPMRVTLWGLMVSIAGVGVCLGLILPHLSPDRRSSMIESLEAPVSVRGWSEAGLQLEDGRVAPLPGLKKLPLESAALAEAVSRGVEVAKDGRIVGLVRVYPSCGMAAWRALRRVDLSMMLLYLRECEAAVSVPDDELDDLCPEGDELVSSQGCREGDFFRFVRWRNKTMLRPASSSQSLR